MFAAADSIDFDVLLEHLVETTKEDLHLRNQSQSEVSLHSMTRK